MDKHDKQVFHWVVRQGNITAFADNDKLHLEINKENNPICLLNERDTEDVIDILTNIAAGIWNSPGYIKEPYSGVQFTHDENGRSQWIIADTRLTISLNEQQDALEIDIEGNPIMKLSVNLATEIIQVMTQYYHEI